MSAQTLTTTRLNPTPATFLSRLLDRVFAADAAFRQQHALRQLPDHMLKDIGVRRTHFSL